VTFKSCFVDCLSSFSAETTALKVIQLAPYFVPYRGGQELYVLRLSRWLEKMGHEVEVVTSNFPPTKDSEEVQGITVRRLRCIGRILRNPLTPGFLALGKYLNDCDVVHAHNEHSSASICAAFLRLSKEIPLVLTCHGQLRFNEPVSDSLERIYTKTFGREVFRLADGIIALTPSDKEYIASLGVDSEKIRVIPNAVDLSEMLSDRDHNGRLLEK